MDETHIDEDELVASATPEEQRMAESIFDALKHLAPDAFMTGNPRAGRMQMAFDGEFNLLSLARLLASPQDKKSHSSGI